MSQDLLPLADDCARCQALCCMALAFTRSAQFAFDKPAGTACPHLAADFRCRIHDRLDAAGFRGCAAYSCFGAGPHLTAALADRDWRTDRDAADRAVAALPVVRQVHELLWHLRAALAEPVRGRLRDQLHVAHAETTRLARAAVASPDSAGAAEHREKVLPLLRAASAELRGPGLGPDLAGADLIGARLSGRDLRRASLRGALLTAADLRGADLRRADLAGADLRDADLTGADLRGALFVTPEQLRSARAAAGIRLIADLLDPRLAHG